MPGLFALIKFGNLFIDFFLILLGKVFDRLANQFTTVNKDAPFLAFEQNTIAEVDVTFVALVVVIDIHYRAVFEFQIDTKLNCRVVPIGQCDITVQKAVPIEITWNDPKEIYPLPILQPVPSDRKPKAHWAISI